MAILAMPTRDVRNRNRDVALPTWTVVAAAAVAVLSRLPFIGRAPSPDEAGFLLVGGQWNGAGSSLYGSYWVDRPPLLVTIFRVASAMGGLPALRLIGCCAVLLIVLGTARAAHLLGGDQAGRWAAVSAAAWCLTPLLGGYAVNGELLAAPFVVGGLIAVILALRAPDPPGTVRLAMTAGALAMCAVLVKQNFADVAVFGAVSAVAARRRSDITVQRFLVLVGGAAIGAALALAAIALWTRAHGTSLSGVFDAMYPFRVDAGRVMAAGSHQRASARLHGMIAAAVLSGLAPAAVLALTTVGRRRSAESWALSALLVFAGASALVGGSYWHHYLMGLVVPVSVAAGVLAAGHHRLARAVLTYAVVSAVLAWAMSLAHPQGSADQTVGRAVGAVARPGDTMTSLYGHADIVRASGLASPYPHLWSLPIRTLDPGLANLDSVLSGPSAPVWLVTGPRLRSWGLRTGDTAAIVARDYSEVRDICHRRVYLHDGVSRAAPAVTVPCRGKTSALTVLKELLP